MARESSSSTTVSTDEEFATSMFKSFSDEEFLINISKLQSHIDNIDDSLLSGYTSSRDQLSDIVHGKLQRKRKWDELQSNTQDLSKKAKISATMSADVAVCEVLNNLLETNRTPLVIPTLKFETPRLGHKSNTDKAAEGTSQLNKPELLLNRLSSIQAAVDSWKTPSKDELSKPHPKTMVRALINDILKLREQLEVVSSKEKYHRKILKGVRKDITPKANKINSLGVVEEDGELNKLAPLKLLLSHARVSLNPLRGVIQDALQVCEKILDTLREVMKGPVSVASVTSSLSKVDLSDKK